MSADMPRGTLKAIFIAAEKTGPMEARSLARALEGKGLEGDRYAFKEGSFSKTPGDGRHVTLIEAEALAAAARDYKITLAPGETRRNLLTEGVALNHLVGREFRVGEAVLRGTRLCEPCGHLEKLTRPGVIKAFVHRGGLRAEIVRGGTLRVGDAVQL